ncbi:MAG: OmpH family outer membrane protein [Proteobacteria bacterium]|nr:OmpH family outer membrane protein [Pseudomonadota bacterium]
MEKKLKLALLSCLIVVPLFLKAYADELTIAYVNMERVIREAPAAINASKKMEQEFEGRRQDLQRIADDIASRQAALAEKGASLSDSQRRAKEEELAAISVRFQRRQQEFQEDLNIRKNSEASSLLDKANKAIAQIADAEHLDMIFQEAVAVSNRLDITDKVIKKLTAN